jgi:outer membrane protein TolC
VIPREKLNAKHFAPIAALLATAVFAVLVFYEGSGMAGGSAQDNSDLGSRISESRERSFDLARKGGDRYVYDPESGKWVLVSDAAKTTEPVKDEPSGPSDAELISEYLEKAKRFFADGDLKNARDYAQKVIGLDSNNRQAQFLVAKIDDSESDTTADVILSMEQARARAEELVSRKKIEEAQAETVTAEEQEKTVLFEPPATGEKVTFAPPKKITSESMRKPDVDIAFSTEEVRRKAREEALIRDERYQKEQEEAASQKRQLVSAYIAQGENSLLAEDFEDARDYARNAMEVLPDNEDARKLLAKVDTSEAEYRDHQRRVEEKRIEDEEKQKRAERLEALRIEAEREAARIEAEGERLKQEEARLEEEERRLSSEGLRKEQEEIERSRVSDEKARRAERVTGYIAQADESISRGDFSSARKYAADALGEDENNERAREMLDSIDRAEIAFNAEQRKAEEAALRAKPSITQRYMDKAKENLEKEKFRNARKYAIKAVEEGYDKDVSRELMAEIDLAEAMYREKHGIVSRKPVREKSVSADEVLRRQLKLEAIKKRENIEIRMNIKKARQFLEEGKYKDARKYAYKAWQDIPHDTQVAVLIADINKEEMFGPDSDPTGDLDENTISDTEIISGEDPLKKDDEQKSLADLGGYLLTGLFEKKTFDLGETDTGKELTIDDCVEIALRSNQRITVADEQVKLAEARLWETRRKFFPEATLKHEIAYGKIADPGGGQPGATRHYQGKKYQAEIKQNLFDGFGTFFEIRQMQTNLDIIMLEKRKIRNEVIEETKKAYFNLDKAIKAHLIQERRKERIGQMHELMDKAFRQDLVSKVDYLKVKGQDLQADFHLISGREDINLAEMILLQAMDMDPDSRIRIKPVEKPEKLLHIGLQNCYNLALANSPDFRIKEKSIEYYNFERKMKKAKGWPKIDFHGSFGKSWEEYQPMRDPTDWDGNDPNRATTGLEPEWYAGIKASIPFWGSTIEYNYVREFWATTVSAFRGSESATSYFNLKILDDLAYFTGVQEARVGFERAKYEYTKAKKDLAVKVKEIYFKYRKSLIQMRVAEAQVEHQKMFVAVLEERRKFGEMDIPRIAEEWEKLSENEYGVLQGDADYFISITELNTAIGVADYFDPWNRAPEEFSGPDMILSEAQDIRPAGEIDLASVRSGARTDKTEQYVSRARGELGKGNFDSARKMAIKAIEINGDNQDARDLLGEIDSAEGLHRERIARK